MVDANVIALHDGCGNRRRDFSDVDKWSYENVIPINQQLLCSVCYAVVLFSRQILIN